MFIILPLCCAMNIFCTVQKATVYSNSNAGADSVVDNVLIFFF